LFVAHREEILQQAVQTYRNVLQDGNFGDLWVGSSRPNSLEYLFVSVQTFNSRFEDCFAKLSENYYDYIVIDEAHHSTADSYRKILEHFKPQLLLGLTATPERMDGASLLPDFDNRISAEIRLPKALDEGLLTPFQYFCISDSVTDLRDNELMEGRRYVTSKIYDKLCTKQRVGLIVRSLQRYLADEHKCRALCFCADKRQAEYMAKMLREAGLNAACLTSNNSDERKSLNERLASGEINYLCVVDMFNEGVDIPEVDTVLFLRPTESLTIFLQQLGRGLRLSPGKQVLTVLDYVAQLNSKYDYAGRFRRLMVRTDGDLKKQIEQGFTLLPSGCSIHMEEKARQYVLSNINSAIYDKRRLVNELRNYLECPTLSKFIEELDQDVRIVYKGGYCWTRLKRDAGKSAYKDDDITKHLEKGIGNLAHVNTISYLRFIEKVMRKPEDITWVEQREQPYIIMLYYALFQVRIKELDVSSIAEAIAKLQYYPMFVQEIQELVAYLLEHIEQTTYSLDEQLPALLEQYGCYTREEVFTLFGRQTATKKMQGMVSGVFNVEEWNTELLFVTLNKSDVDFSPSTQYDDYVMSETLFHWQSQNTDSHQGTGARFVNQQSNGKRFLLFVREDKKDGYSNTAPFYCFGLVDYVRSYGDKPMNVEWRLHKPVMAKFLKAV
jgi:superfamily II DNA or RNA helicase